MSQTAHGTYALLIQLKRDATIAVGRLGSFRFPAGYYVYIGSALGPGGLKARLARHRRHDKTPHWHIDFLLAQAEILGIRIDESGQRLECQWARALLSAPGAQVVAPGMGSSDCGCPSHLIYFDSQKPLWWAEQQCGRRNN
jgi:Uri superfamily endonuclease